ncbi:MAG: hypothetical protein U9N42_08955, partial [Campylobacterota bacterium]|nr:hypothetical protein [Campylobacterota bacterium]
RIESVSYRDTDSNGSYFNIVNNTFYLNPNYPTSTIEDWFESETLIFIAENEVDGTGEYIALNPNDGIVDDFKTVIANIIPYNIEHLDCFPTKITTNNYKDYSYAPTPNEVNSITGSFIHSVEFGDILDYVEYKLVNHNGGVYLDIANGYVDMGMFNWVLDDGRTIKEAYPDIVEDLLQMVSLHSFEKDEEGNAIEDIDNALDGNATLIALTNDTVRNVTTPSLNIVKGESFEGSEQDFNELKDYMTTPNVTFTDSVALPISIGGSGTQSISTQGGFTLNKDYPRSSNNTTVNDSNDSLIEQVNNGIGGVVSDEQQLQNIFNAEKVLRDGKLIFNEKDVHADSVGFTYLYGVALPPSETPFIKNFVDGLDTTLTTLLKSSRTSAYLSTQTANEVASGLITYWVTSRFNDQSFTPELREFYGEVTDADGNSDGNTYIKIYDDNSLDDDGLPAELYSFMHKERIDNTPILSSEYLEEQEKKETEFEINFVFTKNDDGSVTITFTKHPDAPDDYYDYLVFDGKKMKVTKEATDG